MLALTVSKMQRRAMRLFERSAPFSHTDSVGFVEQSKEKIKEKIRKKYIQKVTHIGFWTTHRIFDPKIPRFHILEIKNIKNIYPTPKKSKFFAALRAGFRRVLKGFNKDCVKPKVFAALRAGLKGFKH